MARQTKQKVRLQDSDWAALFPNKKYTIGATEVEITPLSIEELASILDKLSLISDKIQDNIPAPVEGADEATQTSLTILALLRIIMQESPDILSDMSGLDVEDIKSLPLDKALDLFNFCLDVNIESQDSLIKNFNGLGDRISQFMGTKVTSPQTRIPLVS